MKKSPLLITLSGLAALTGCGTAEPPKPNIIYFLADDLGYGEVGCYGQTLIHTPNIDGLAQSGMRFTQHYSGSAVCAPARCILLTGQHSGHAYIRGNHEWGERGEVWNFARASEDPGLEGQYPLADSIVTIAERLREAGYRTGLVGKWGLGAPGSEGDPNNQGFDLFYGYNCQRQAHTYYPLHLWKNQEKDILGNSLVPPNTKLPEGADPYDPASYAPFNQEAYAPDRMITEALDFIERSGEDPFFLYFASPIPHAPLQAPQEWVDRYVEIFGEEEPYLGQQGYFPHRYPMAAYAAMVSYMDHQLGQLIEKLKELGKYENTLILFSSDNGPSFAGGANPDWFNASEFRVAHGYGKGFLHEGGIRVPMIASWPGRIEAGSETGILSAFYDIFPTFCEIARIDPEVPVDGISMVPTLLGKGKQQEHDFLYWGFPEYGGQQAVRLENWKGIRKNMQKGNLEIELYDLENDPKEMNNLAAQNPEMVERIRTIMEQEHRKSEISRFWLKPLDVLTP